MFHLRKLQGIGNAIYHQTQILPAVVQRHFHEEYTAAPVRPNEIKPKTVPTAVASKYQLFKDDDASVILDIEEERQRLTDNSSGQETLPDIYAGLNLERGVTGVFEIDDLVEVLLKDNAHDVFVCSVPKALKYVDYVCVVTGRSQRHRKAMAQFVRKMFKLKMNGTTDVIPKIEGVNSKDWIALDLGNIALHIFSEEARAQYDLESLWTVGPEFDRECNKPNDELVELYEKHSIYLGDLTPNSKT